MKPINCLFFLLMVFLSCKGQDAKDPIQVPSSPIIENRAILGIVDTIQDKYAPTAITRTILQDKKGRIWLATFDGIYKYEQGKFSLFSEEISQDRFFSVMEDSKGTIWLGSIGSGVYHYDGETLQNLTTDNGLINNEIISIYEDKSGRIWFGANGGFSCYSDGEFVNYVIDKGTIKEAEKGRIIPNLQRPPNEVNVILEDQSGKIWIGTRGNTFVYDGKTFEVVTGGGRSFANVRWITEDRKGKIYLAGNDGLWRYDGMFYQNISTDFTGYVYEDAKGNIWTSSQKGGTWALSCYYLFGEEIGTETIMKSGEGMFFGIAEDAGGNIWSGTLKGVYRYDGNKFDYFKK